MAHLMNKMVQFVAEACCVCGIDFCVPDWFQRQRRQDGRSFSCPAGHSQSYTEPEVDRLRRNVARLESRVTHLDDQRQAAERSASAFKGQVTRIRKRLANGVCPCCNRHFANVARHIQSKHPDYAERHEAGEAVNGNG